MNLKIVNKSKLPYKIIGQVIDNYINDDRQITIYYGYTEYFNIEYKDTLYAVQVKYLKRYTEWTFIEK